MRNCVSNSVSGFARVRRTDRRIFRSSSSGQYRNRNSSYQTEEPSSEVDQLIKDYVFEPRFAIGRKAHDLIFAAIDPKSSVIGEGGIQQADRVREIDLFNGFKLAPASDGDRCRRPFPDPIKRQDDRFVKG